jgi:uncharacterized protein YndB with AHSA1/START domain
MTETSTKESKKTIVIDASPEVVFRALTDEKELTQWFSNQRAMLELQVGGAWVFKNRSSDTGENHTMRGRVLEIIQDKKLSYTWNVEEHPDFPETVVTWMLEALDGGSKTKITLVHYGLVATLAT